MRISDWSSDVCSSDLIERMGEALFGADTDRAPGMVKRRFLGHDEMFLPCFRGWRTERPVRCRDRGAHIWAGSFVKRAQLSSRADASASTSSGRAPCRERVCPYV